MGCVRWVFGVESPRWRFLRRAAIRQSSTPTVEAWAATPVEAAAATAPAAPGGPAATAAAAPAARQRRRHRRHDGGTGGRGTGGATGAGGATDGGASGPLKPLIDAYCAAARSCCGKGGFPAANLADCEAMFPMRNDSVASVNKGTAQLDATAFPACVAAYQAAATSCLLGDILTACKNIYVGTKDENEACTTVVDCRHDQGVAVTCLTVQVGDVTPDSGVCRRIPHGKRGDACVSDCAIGDSCLTDTLTGPGNTNLTFCFEQDGLFCSFDTVTCVPLVASGGACQSDHDCAAANYCDTTCQKRAPLGQTCAFTSGCEKDLVCSDDTRKCAQQPLASDYVCMGYPPTP